ncbi:MAG: SH3 domain-containing protein [Spirochaetaceae bacterium]|nr:SH3 domain-containing protein [Spirochaetaceae bacterium]
MSKKILFITTALLILITFTSCNRKIGSGVVLWAPEESAIESGSLVNIFEESKIRHTFTVARPGSKEKMEMDTWRILFFEKEPRAREYSKGYSPYVNSFAYSVKQGLPIREAETSESDRVYKLREGQEIKVIGRAEEPVEIGRFTGYWYHVLTGDGVSGYVFDYYLTVFSLNDTGRVIENAKDTRDPLLDIFLNSTWRPSYYNDMITKNIIDLSSFKDSYALRIDREKKEITLRLHDKNITEYYTDITEFGSKRYDFEGTSFRVTLVSEKVASILYKHDGKDINEAFVRLDENVNEIVSAELARRNGLLQEFIDRGSVFKSENYGSVNIIDGTGRFIWNDIERLIDRKIISPQSEPLGKIEFNHFPDTLIKNIYSGVITFNFRNGSQTNFLYSYTRTGVSFIFVPQRYIKNLIVTTDQFFDPIQIYFEFDPSTPSTGSGTGESEIGDETGEDN